jgi:hypothetical protein
VAEAEYLRLVDLERVADVLRRGHSAALPYGRPSMPTCLPSPKPAAS